MRIRIAPLLALLAPLALVAAPLSAFAQTRGEALEALKSTDLDARRRATLRLGEVGAMADAPQLLARLRDEDDITRAIAEQALWRVWSRSGDAKIDVLFARGLEQMNSGKFREGIATYTEVIRLKPAFAEGWNKRATLYFLAGDYRRSLADCDQVMKRNPDHFGALAGYGQIWLRLDDPEKALGYFRRALDVNPNMDGVRINIDGLERLLETRRGKTI